LFAKIVAKKKRVDASPRNVQSVGELILLKNRDDLYNFLEKSYSIYNRVEYVESDPIFFPTTLNGNKEYIAFVSALFAYGKVRLIKRFLDKFFDYYGTVPDVSKSPNERIYYRFQSYKDIYHLHVYLLKIYEKYGSLEQLLLSYSHNIDEGLEQFVFGVRRYGVDNGLSPGFFQLFPDPKNSGLKRLRMFLRWMIRKDDIDFGLWKCFDKKELLYPIDTHILRFGAKVGILPNETNNLKNAIKITSFFRDINPIDPLKYDFTITRLGMLCGCEFVKNYKCDTCNFWGDCPFC